MSQKNTIFMVLVFQIFVWGIFLSVPAEALAKTVYVEEDGDDSNDGSSDHPYETLEKAAEEVNDGEVDEIALGKGSFPGGVIFESSVSIEGEGKGSTTITGALTFKKKAELKKVSIKTTTQNAVTVGKNGDAKIQDVDIRDYTGVGILLSAGSAVLTLEDSRLGSSAGKGIYAEAGSKLTLIGNTITNNKQEGIDIRQNTRGTIKNNTIENNSESGIELIVGSSDFVISGNKIKNNNASGIAFQFYELNKKFGTITATGNTLSGHRKYGLDCNKPQGGESPTGYWADSLTLDDNTFSSNKMSDISSKCKLLEAKTEEEEKALEEQVAQEEKVEQAVVQPETVTESAVSSEEERMNQENQVAETVVGTVEGIIKEEEYQSLLNHFEQGKALSFWLPWWRTKSLEELRIQLEADRNEILEEKEKLLVIPTYTNRADLQDRVAIQEQKLESYQARFQQYQDEKGALEYIPQETFSRVTKLIYVIIF